MAFATQSAGLVAASSQYFSRADSANLSITGNLTLEALVKFTTTPSSGNAMGILGKWTATGTTNRSYNLSLFNDTGTMKLQFDGRTGADVAVIEAVNWSPSTSVWYHVAVTFNASTGDFKFYVNGVQEGATQGSAAASLSDGTAPFEIGAYNGAANFLNGRIGMCRVWSSVRTEAELFANQCVILGATANLEGEWTLDNTLLDNSGNGETLTNNNVATFTTDVSSVCSIRVGSPTLLLMGV